MTLRRLSPYERVWLFALPLYLLVASAGLVFPRATPFSRRFKRDQRARANFHLARAFTLLLQLVEESLADAVGLAKLRNTEGQARRWRSRQDGSQLGAGFRHARLLWG